MKVLTILGTRPEIIRLSLLIKRLDQYGNHVLVHTGQNFAPRLNEIFFQDLSVRTPDHFLGVRGETFGDQLAQILLASERVLSRESPDRVVILGDTNSGLSAIVARRLGIPVFHLEAGNRCYDDRVPEEINRRIIDHSSSVLLPYTHRSKENLLREGIESNRIHVIGNPIYEVLRAHEESIRNSSVHSDLEIEAHKYFLVTLHRAENVDLENRLKSLISGLEAIGRRHEMPLICSLHPRTKNRLQALGMAETKGHIRFVDPLNFTDFVALEKQARCVITDSGTVQEECCIFHIPNVTIRDVTERPETIESGSNILAGASPERIVHCVDVALQEDREWTTPDEYVDPHVSSKVVKILMGYDNRSEAGTQRS